MNRNDTAQAVGAKLVRVGGDVSNDVSGYNWEVNATHLGDHGDFHNAPFGSGDPGAAANTVLDIADANGGGAMLVVPIGGWVAADSIEDDVRDTPDTLNERFRLNVAVKGSSFANPPDTSDDTVYQDEFVDSVRLAAEPSGTPVVFALDNHASLWSYEFSLIHPDKPGYDDVVEPGIEFATAIKDAFPDAEVAGPAEYGWQGYIDLQGSEDYETEGDFLEYYLTRMATAEADYGARLLDYLDVHWWPEAGACRKRIIVETSEPAIAEARMQAPRSLWDPTYVEDSWVAALRPINLISKMNERIDNAYPGTKLAFSAWYYGGGSDISGAIAAADVLGIFGREGIGLASVSLPDEAPYVTAAFQAFLNYDGAGAHFGDTSVASTTDDLEGASAYASIESGAPTQLVIVLMNKRNAIRPTTINIDSATSYGTSLVYELTDEGPTVVAVDSLSATSDNTFSYEMPPISIAVIVPQLAP